MGPWELNRRAPGHPGGPRHHRAPIAPVPAAAAVPSRPAGPAPGAPPHPSPAVDIGGRAAACGSGPLVAGHLRRSRGDAPGGPRRPVDLTTAPRRLESLRARVETPSSVMRGLHSPVDAAPATFAEAFATNAAIAAAAAAAVAAATAVPARIPARKADSRAGRAPRPALPHAPRLVVPRPRAHALHLPRQRRRRWHVHRERARRPWWPLLRLGR